MKVFGHAPGKTPSLVVLHPLYSVPEQSLQCRRPRHLVQLPGNECPHSGSVWWPPPPVALEQVSTATQPGSSRATGGGGHHTEPAMWRTLISGKLCLELVESEPATLPHARGTFIIHTSQSCADT